MAVENRRHSLLFSLPDARTPQPTNLSNSVAKDGKGGRRRNSVGAPDVGRRRFPFGGKNKEEEETARAAQAVRDMYNQLHANNLKSFLDSDDEDGGIPSERGQVGDLGMGPFRRRRSIGKIEKRRGLLSLGRRNSSTDDNTSDDDDLSDDEDPSGSQHAERTTPVVVEIWRKLRNNSNNNENNDNNNTAPPTITTKTAATAPPSQASNFFINSDGLFQKREELPTKKPLLSALSTSEKKSKGGADDYKNNRELAVGNDNANEVTMNPKIKRRSSFGGEDVAEEQQSAANIGRVRLEGRRRRRMSM